MTTAPAATTTTTPKRWIVGKDGRRCHNTNCQGYDTANAKILSIEPDGTINLHCKHCGDDYSRQANEYKERRKCKTCPNVRDVTVRIWSGGKEHARDCCTPCEMEQSAARHLATYRDLTTRAKAMRRARGERV